MYLHAAAADAWRVHIYLHASGATSRHVCAQKPAGHTEQQKVFSPSLPVFIGLLAMFG